MNDADVDALCDLFDSMENAVVVLYTVFKDDKAKQTKKAKKLLDCLLYTSSHSLGVGIFDADTGNPR